MADPTERFGTGRTNGPFAQAAGRCTPGTRRREHRDHRIEWMVTSRGPSVPDAGLRDGDIRFPWPDTP